MKISKNRSVKGRTFISAVFAFLLLACFFAAFRVLSAVLPGLSLLSNTTDQRAREEQTMLIANGAPETGIRLPIVMYHGFLKDKDSFRRNKFYINPRLFEKDLEYLTENNYTPIFIEDLISYVEKGTPLPENPIILTFDDGYYNNYFYIYPLLRAYDMKAVISIIGSLTDKFSLTVDNNILYSHLTWDQINEMQGSGLIEIQNHSYRMHSAAKGRKGSASKPGESREAYERGID